MLVKQGSDVNILDRNGITALHAVDSRKEGEQEMLKVCELLNNKADVDITDHLGYTALHLAVKWGNLKIVAKLSPALDIC